MFVYYNWFCYKIERKVKTMIRTPDPWLQVARQEQLSVGRQTIIATSGNTKSFPHAWINVNFTYVVPPLHHPTPSIVKYQLNPNNANKVGDMEKWNNWIIRIIDSLVAQSLMWAHCISVQLLAGSDALARLTHRQPLSAMNIINKQD